MSRSNKLKFRWLGPFRVKTANLERGTYTLEELDGAKLGGTVAGSRLKLFHPRPDGFTVTRSMPENEQLVEAENEQLETSDVAQDDQNAQETSIFNGGGEESSLGRREQSRPERPRRPRIEVRI